MNAPDRVWLDDLVTRTGRMRPLRGRLAAAVPEDVQDAMDAQGRSRIPSEVEVQPGVCVTWRCTNAATDGLECAEHAAEPLPEFSEEYRAIKARDRRKSYHANIERAREGQRDRTQRWRASLTPEQRKALNAARRAKRAEQAADPEWLADYKAKAAARYQTRKQRAPERAAQ